jgi:hypothetical protein
VLLQTGQLPEFIHLPHSQQLLLVLRCPIPNQPLRPQGQIAFHHLQGLNVEDTVELSIDSVKVRNAMLTLIHFDNDAVKASDDWHNRTPARRLLIITLRRPMVCKSLDIRTEFTNIRPSASCRSEDYSAHHSFDPP